MFNESSLLQKPLLFYKEKKPGQVPGFSNNPLIDRFSLLSE